MQHAGNISFRKEQEMKRRKFLVKAGALFSLPLIITEIGCDSDDLTDPGDSSNTFNINSTRDNGHIHSISISSDLVEKPPSESKTITSSNSVSHTHRITLGQSDFESLAAGETVIKTSTSSSGHTHRFSIVVP